MKVEVTGGRRQFYDELHNLCALFARHDLDDEIRWDEMGVGGRYEIYTQFLLIGLKERDSPEDLEIDKNDMKLILGSTILECGSGHRPMAGSCEDCNKILGFTKCGEFLDCLYILSFSRWNFSMQLVAQK